MVFAFLQLIAGRERLSVHHLDVVFVFNSTIGNSCLIGMGAIVLNGAVLGDNCVVGAGAVVTGKMNAPAGSVLLGSPARIVKQVSPEMQAATETDADIYIERAKRDLPAAEDIS